MHPQTSESSVSPVESQPTERERVVLRPRTSAFEQFATVSTSVSKAVSDIPEIRTQKDAVAQFGPLDGKHEYIPNMDGIFDGSYGTIQVATEIVKQRTEEQIGSKAPESLTPIETTTAPSVEDKPKTVGGISIETTSPKDEAAISSALATLLARRTDDAIAHAQASIDTPPVSPAPVIEEVHIAPVVDNVLAAEPKTVETPITTTTVETVTHVTPPQEEIKPTDESTHVIPIRVIPQDIKPQVADASASVVVETAQVEDVKVVASVEIAPEIKTDVPNQAIDNRGGFLKAFDKFVGIPPVKTPVAQPAPVQVVAPQVPQTPVVQQVPLPPVAPIVGEKEAVQEAELTLLRAKNMILEINPHLEADLIEIFGNIPEISYTKDMVLPKLNPKAYLDLQQQTVESIQSQREVAGSGELKSFAALLQHYIADSETPALPQETAHDYLLRLSKKVEELTKGNPPQAV